MPVGWHRAFHLRFIGLPRQPGLQEYRKQPQTLCFRPADLQCVLEIQIVQHASHHETQPFGICDRCFLPEPKTVHHPLAELAWNRRNIIVIEERHVTTQPVRFIVYRFNQEPPLPSCQHVKPPVGIPVYYSLDHYRAAHVDDSAAFRQYNAKFRPGRLRLPHHFPVAFFENMQGNGVSRQHHQLQGKQRKQRRHGAIIAVPDRYYNLFDGKIVIITGASEGIGSHLAAALLQSGARVALAARSEEHLRTTAAVNPDNALIIPGDVTLPAVRAGIIEQTIKRWGRIDVLVNNAGRGSYFAPSTAPLDDARALFELNVFAALALAQLATPHLRETRGSIVNVCSIAAQIPLPWLPVYSASKAALASLTATQRIELRRAGIHVMGVFPGYVDTDFQNHAAGSRPPGKIVQGKRWSISPEGCAAAILRGLAQRKPTVVTPQSGWPLVIAHRLFPRFVESRLEAV